MRLQAVLLVPVALSLSYGALWALTGDKRDIRDNSSPVVVPAGARFACSPIAVWDGDGPIWCAEGPRVRLEGIAARELDGTCRPGHPCPPSSGVSARDYLVRLLGGPVGSLSTGHVAVNGPRLSCVSAGNAKGSRTAALCRSPSTGDLSCAMVQSGYALRWPRYGGDQVCRD